MELNTCLGHDTAGTNSAALADGHTSQNDDATSDPAIITNVDLLAILWTTPSVPQLRISGMGAGVEGDTGAEENPLPDINETSIDDHTIGIDEGSFANSDVVAIITAERR